MRTTALALALVVAAAAPSGAGWTVTTTADPASGTTAALVPVAAPRVSAQCFIGGTISVSISWTPTDAHVTGYEVYRLRDGAATRIADVPATTTSATDGGSFLATTLRYYVVGKTGAWRAASGQTQVATSC